MRIEELNIAIIDFYHVDSPAAYLNVLQPVCKKIIVITSNSIAQNLKGAFADQTGIIFKILPDDSAENRLSIEKILHDEGIDLCIFSTIERYFISFLEIFKTYKGIKLPVIHNANFWFRKKRKLKIFREPRNPDHVAKLEMIKMASALIVLDKNIAEYIHKRFRTRKPIICFSLAQTVEMNGTQHEHLKLKVVIPGNIEKSRKDFDMVLDALESLPKEKVVLTILGGPRGNYGQHILSRADALKNLGYEIKTYPDFVPQTEFNKQMEVADLVVLPIQPKTSFAAIEEIYGRTKISGSVYDTIRYGKPGLISASFPLSDELEKRFRQFGDTANLVKNIHQFLDKKFYLAELDSIRNLTYWDLQSVRSRFVKDLENISKQ